MTTAVSNFCVISTDDHSEPARCSYCARAMKHVVVLPLAGCPELKYRIIAAAAVLQIGLCAHCVLAMAKALAAAEGKIS